MRENPRPDVYVDDASDEGFDLGQLRHFVHAPLRRPLLVVVPWVTILALSVVAFFLLPKRYKSSTLIMVESEKVPDSFVAKVATEDRSQRLEAIRPEILSRTRLERVLEETRPYPDIDSTTAAVDMLRRKISINISGNDGFTLEFVHANPQKAQEVANRLATLFIEETVNAREAQVVGAVDFLVTQVTDARQQLENKDEALRRYKEARMGSLPEQLQTNLATMQMLQREMQTVEESLIFAREKRDALARGSRSASAAPAGGARSATEELDELRQQLASLRGRYTEEHPDVQSLKARVTRLESRLGAEGPDAQGDPSVSIAREQLTQAQLEVKRLEDRRSDLDRRISALRGPGRGDAPDGAGALQPEARLRQAERELLGSPEQAARGADGGAARAAVEGRPLPDARPGEPPGETLLPQGSPGHRARGRPGSLRRDRPLPRRGVRGPDGQGRARAGVDPDRAGPGPHPPRFEPRSLGPMSRNGFTPDAKSAEALFKEEGTVRPTRVVPIIESLKDPRSMVGEEFRLLRAKLQEEQQRRQRPIERLAVVSALPGEGKSTISLGLSAALARDAGRRVLLIEADMRRPSISRSLGLPPCRGLTDFLNGERERVPLRRLDPGGFSLLSAGTTELERPEEIGSARMEALLRAAGKRFDIVVIDATPILPVADVILLQELVDALLMVVRSRVTPRDAIQEALGRIRSDKVIGVVLNDHREYKDSYMTYAYHDYGMGQRSGSSRSSAPIGGGAEARRVGVPGRLAAHPRRAVQPPGLIRGSAGGGHPRLVTHLAPVEGLRHLLGGARTPSPGSARRPEEISREPLLSRPASGSASGRGRSSSRAWPGEAARRGSATRSLRRTWGSRTRGSGGCARCST